MKKSFVLAIILILIVLLISNYRYPFVQTKSEGWSIGIASTANPFKIPYEKLRIYNKSWLDSLTSFESSFLADPFLVQHDGNYYIFFEHQPEKGKGRIDLLISSDGLNFKYAGNVLEESFHLSFPYVFKHNGEFYMLPETKEANNVILYKAKEFPYNWSISDTLIKNKKLKDPAIFISDSLKILMASDDNLNQFLYTSSSLQGSWKLDPNFTIRRGDETRAGGNFFSYNDNLYLPLQNNKDGYGSGVSIYKLKINQGKFELVKEHDRLLKGNSEIIWFNRGMHHLNLSNIDDNFIIVVDGDKLAEDNSTYLSWKASLKYNYYDLERWVKKKFS